MVFNKLDQNDYPHDTTNQLFTLLQPVYIIKNTPLKPVV